MKENLDINKELKEIAPLLSKQDKNEEGYNLPFNYFEVLPDQIMAKVQPEVNEPVMADAKKSPSLLNWLTSLLQPRYALTLAAMVGAIMVGSYIFTGATETSSDAELLAASITAEDARLYVQENLDDFALELLADDETVELDYNTIFDLNESDLQQYIEEEVLEDLEEHDLL